MKMFGPRTIRAKLTLTTMVVMAALLGALALIVDVGAQRTINNSINEDLRQRGEDFRSNIVRRMEHRPDAGMGPMGPPPNAMRFQMPKQSENNSGIRPRFISLENQEHFGPKESPYDSIGFQAAKNGNKTFTSVIKDNEPVRIYSAPVIREGRVIGVVQVCYPVAESIRSLGSLRRLLLTFVIPLGVLLSGVASLFLVERLMRPLRLITQNAEAIEASKLSDRLPIVGQDEFALLGVTLNNMLSRVETAFRIEQETARQLEETVKQQRRFTADASHELKTPLAVIKANTGLMLHLSGSAEENRESVQAIDHAADRMNRLVRDLLVLARTDGGQMANHFEPNDIRDVVSEALQQIAGSSERVSLSLPEKPVMLNCSKDELVRVFINLVDNAMKHSGSTEPVEVRISENGPSIEVSVADKGAGIEEKHLPHLFERFYRTDGSRTSSTGGTGLGLAICKGIVEAHGGRIDVTSEPNVATVFTVSLPLHQVQTKA